MDDTSTGGEESDLIDAQSNRHNDLTWKSTLALITLTFCQSMAVRIMTLPLNRLIESRYCLDYYRHHIGQLAYGFGETIPEERCKVDAVQRQLAVLQGIVETLHVFCG